MVRNPCVSLCQGTAEVLRILCRKFGKPTSTPVGCDGVPFKRGVPRMPRWTWAPGRQDVDESRVSQPSRWLAIQPAEAALITNNKVSTPQLPQRLIRREMP